MRFSAKKFCLLVLVILLFIITSCPQNAGQNTDTKPFKKSDYAGNHYVNGTLVPDEIYEEYYTKTYGDVSYTYNNGFEVYNPLIIPKKDNDFLTLKYTYDDNNNGEHIVNGFGYGAYYNPMYNYTLIYEGNKENFKDICSFSTEIMSSKTNIKIITTDSSLNFTRNYKDTDWIDYNTIYTNI